LDVEIDYIIKKVTVIGNPYMPDVLRRARRVDKKADYWPPPPAPHPPPPPPPPPHTHQSPSAFIRTVRSVNLHPRKSPRRRRRKKKSPRRRRKKKSPRRRRRRKKSPRRRRRKRRRRKRRRRKRRRRRRKRKKKRRTSRRRRTSLLPLQRRKQWYTRRMNSWWDVSPGMNTIPANHTTRSCHISPFPTPARSISIGLIFVLPSLAPRLPFSPLLNPFLIRVLVISLAFSNLRN
jgi:hypothetical protein